MSDLRDNLKSEFQDVDYRYAYAESFLNTKIASQIKTLREQRGKKQAEIGTLIGTKQSGFSRFEDVNHSVWKTDTLWKIARALDVRLNISFETFGSLIEEKERFSREELERPEFEKDPVFKEPEQGPTEEIEEQVKENHKPTTPLLEYVARLSDQAMGRPTQQSEQYAAYFEIRPVESEKSHPEITSQTIINAVNRALKLVRSGPMPKPPATETMIQSTRDTPNPSSEISEQIRPSAAA